MEKYQPNAPSFMIDFLFGGTAAAFSKTIIAPLERVKLLLQTQDVHKKIRDGKIKKYTGIQDCLIRVTKEEGFFNLWRGNLANVIRYFPTQALNFAFKDTFRKWLCPYNAKKDPMKFFLGSLISGGVAGGISLMIVYPLDFARTRLGADLCDIKYGRQFNGMNDCLKKVYRIDGMAGLYKGFIISMIGIFIYRAFYFGGFDSAKKLLFEDFEHSPFIIKFFVAQCVTSFAGFVSYPLDTVKRRLMMQSGGKEILYKGSMDCMIKIRNKEGSLAFFKGGYSNFIRGIGGSLVLVFYDEIHSYLGFSTSSN